MKKFLNILSVLLVLSALAACKYATIVPDVPPADQTVYFSTDLQPTFTSNCASCHKSGGPKPDLTAGNSYQSIITNNQVVPGNADNSILYQKIISGGSMSAFSNSQFTGLVKNWINQGAKDN